MLFAFSVRIDKLLVIGLAIRTAANSIVIVSFFSKFLKFFIIILLKLNINSVIIVENTKKHHTRTGKYLFSSSGMVLSKVKTYTRFACNKKDKLIANNEGVTDMRNLKRKAILMGLVAMMVLPAANVSASNKAFTNYTFTTTANTEVWKSVVAKSKPDAEQNWYVTLTKEQNLPSSSSQQSRAQVISSDTVRNIGGRVPLPLYKSNINSTRKIAYGSLKAKKGKTYRLYISGDENNSRSYKITISGRYTS